LLKFINSILTTGKISHQKYDFLRLSSDFSSKTPFPDFSKISLLCFLVCWTLISKLCCAVRRKAPFLYFTAVIFFVVISLPLYSKDFAPNKNGEIFLIKAFLAS